MNKTQYCKRCILPSFYPGITFDEKGICSICRSFDSKLTIWHEEKKKQERTLETLCRDAKSKKRSFDALIPLSGGKDSIYVLWYAVEILNLNVLAFSMNNGYLTNFAKNNIENACTILGVEHIYYNMSKKLMNRMFRVFMEKTGYFCSICMRCIEMTSEILAELYDIPLVFGGSSARTELPLTSIMFQPGKIDYVKNVLKNELSDGEIKRLLYRGSIKRRIGKYFFWWINNKRIVFNAWINLPDYIDWDYEVIYKTIKEKLNWKSPTNSLEHVDCALHSTSEYIHDKRFKGVEIEVLSSARSIQIGKITREQALEKVKNADYRKHCVSEKFLKNIGMTRKEFDEYVDLGPRYINYRKQKSKLYLMLRRIKRTIIR